MLPKKGGNVGTDGAEALMKREWRLSQGPTRRAGLLEGRLRREWRSQAWMNAGAPPPLGHHPIFFMKHTASLLQRTQAEKASTLQLRWRKISFLLNMQKKKRKSLFWNLKFVDSTLSWIELQMKDFKNKQLLDKRNTSGVGTWINGQEHALLLWRTTFQSQWWSQVAHTWL